MRVELNRALIGVSMLALASPALAQSNDENKEIVVTGTLIRGVEATGSQTIGLSEEDIAISGASTTNELLNDLPQVSGFNDRFDNDPRAGDRLQVSRPNLRNLPGVTSATGATTLILVDGHRMTPMGVDQASFDPDFIPAGAIRRIEVVTDGGSSLYGADAVGGVINFITRKDYDGVEVNGSYEIGDKYNAWGTGLTFGKTWEDGSAFVAYSYYNRDELLNKDRSYAARGQWNADGTVLSPSGTQCLDPVGAITTWRSFGAGWTTNAGFTGVSGPEAIGTPCDIDAESALLPKLDRHSVMVGLSQELAPNLTVDMKANYGRSSVSFSKYPLGDTVSEPAPTAAAPFGTFTTTSAVGFSYGANSAYVDRKQKQTLEVYGFSPEFTYKAGNGWQIKTTAYWGESQSTSVLPGSNREKLTAYVADGSLDITNVGAASSAVIADILDYEAAGETVQSLFLVRTIVDGGLFDLPAGTVKAAVGVEYNSDEAKTRSGSYNVGGLAFQPFRRATRNVKSVFGELSVPVFSMLDLSLSGRYDDYSDFGDTFNPNIGLSFKPVDSLKIYGHWGKSFNAPTALDSVRPANARFIANAAAGVPDPNGELTGQTNDDVLLLEGSGGGLQPQKAETWSAGFEFEPVSNLTFGANYYDIKFTNLLGAVNPQLASVVLLNPDKFIFNPTQAEFDAFLAASVNGAQFADINAADVGVIIDRRVANIGAARLKGLDFSANYLMDTGFGSMNFGIAGNKQFSFNITENGNTVDQLQYDQSDFNMLGYIGVNSGGFSARVTGKYTAGFDTNIAVNQTKVGSFFLTDLYLGYEFPQGFAVRLNVDNVFDKEPPVYRQQRNLNYSGFTLGRIFKLSVGKTF